MGNEHGEWILHGLSENDPNCIRSAQELLDYVNRVGFLPLFQNEIPGFSVEEHTAARYWWTDDEERDPWYWRQVLARSGKVVYGKLFGQKAGYVSLKWFPVLANYRRNGYDFDARFEDGYATHRSKKIMDLFGDGASYYSFEVKEKAGFGKNGEKNFEGTVSELQRQTYLIVRDFRKRINKSGVPYGWSIAVYATPESVWGYETVTAAYRQTPQNSLGEIIEHLHARFPDAKEEQILKIIW